MKSILTFLLGGLCGWWLGRQQRETTIDLAESPAADLTPDRDRLQQALNDAQAEIRRLEARLSEMSTTTTPDREDDLSKITGIGPVFAQRLNEAGIRTFGQLAQLSPDQIETIIQPRPFQKPDLDAWITQAKNLS